MQHFQITEETAQSCRQCCCQAAKGSPGEVDKWVLNYASVILPANAVALLQTPEFSMTRLGCGSSPDPRDDVLPELQPVTLGGTYLGDLTPLVTGANLEFALVPFTGPKSGRLTVNANGTYNYTPLNGFTGYERFFWQVSIDGAPPVIQEAILGVGVPSPPVTMLRADVIIRNPVIDNSLFLVEFPVDVSPAARVGDVWRIQVRQGYRDCNGCYYTIDCFDLTIGSCG